MEVASCHLVGCSAATALMRAALLAVVRVLAASDPSLPMLALLAAAASLLPRRCAACDCLRLAWSYLPHHNGVLPVIVGEL